ncbi:unnamed protein product [Rotaria socialis]|uniref:Uncharacterized protein n=2 Tax=Rotaria socialis TaxID=392032 RepID=A0A818UVG3_9BILA|nr:unnamed protein product [Rotaria socialis]
MATAMQTGVEAYYVPRNTFVPQTTAKSLDLDSLPEIKGARARRVPAGAKFACKPLIAVGFLVVAAAAVAIAVPFLLVPQQHQRQRLALPLPRQHQQHQQQVQRLLQQQLQQLLQQQVQRLLQQQPQHQRQALRQHQRQALRQHPQQRQQQPALPAHQQHRRPQHQIIQYYDILDKDRGAYFTTMYCKLPLKLAKMYTLTDAVTQCSTEHRYR